MSLYIEINNVSNLVGNGRLKEALNLIEKNLLQELNVNEKNQFLLIKSQLSMLNEQIISRVISEADQRLEKNQITYSILEFLTKIKEDKVLINTSYKNDKNALSEEIRLFRQEYNIHRETIGKFKSVDKDFARILSSETLDLKQMEKINRDFSEKIDNLIDLNNKVIELESLESTNRIVINNSRNWHLAYYLKKDIQEKMLFSEIPQYQLELAKLSNKITKDHETYNNVENMRSYIFWILIFFITYLVYTWKGLIWAFLFFILVLILLYWVLYFLIK